MVVVGCGVGDVLLGCLDELVFGMWFRLDRNDGKEIRVKYCIMYDMEEIFYDWEVDWEVGLFVCVVLFELLDFV